MMNIPKRLIIDIEKNKGAFGFFVHTSENGEKFDIELAGKVIIPVPQNERAHKIYKLLEEHCDVIFCTTQVLDDFSFYPVPQFSIFAVDSKDNCFGTIGGSGNIVDNDYPVGYVSRKGRYGRIASILKEFLSLVTFYPYWWDVIRCEQMGLSYDINAMEIEKLENNSQYFARQQEIQETLKLSNNPKSIELLIANIKSPPEFMVYASKDEVQKTKVFLDTSLKHRISTGKGMTNNRLLEKYKHKIVPGERSIEELIDFLKGKVDIMEIDTTEFSQFFIQQHLLSNVVHCIKNQELKLTADDLNIIAYKIIKNNRSNSYHQRSDRSLTVKNHKDDMIYVFFEKRTGYINSNCNKLLLELSIERGISQYDYDNDTSLLHSYLFRLESYSSEY